MLLLTMTLLWDCTVSHTPVRVKTGHGFGVFAFLQMSSSYLAFLRVYSFWDIPKVAGLALLIAGEVQHVPGLFDCDLDLSTTRVNSMYRLQFLPEASTPSMRQSFRKALPGICPPVRDEGVWNCQSRLETVQGGMLRSAPNRAGQQ